MNENEIYEVEETDDEIEETTETGSNGNGGAMLLGAALAAIILIGGKKLYEIYKAHKMEQDMVNLDKSMAETADLIIDSDEANDEV